MMTIIYSFDKHILRIYYLLNNGLNAYKTSRKDRDKACKIQPTLYVYFKSTESDFVKNL